MESIFKWKINFARDARRIAHSRGETSGKSRMIDRGNKSEKIEAEEAPAPSPSVGTGRNKNVGGGRRDCIIRHGMEKFIIASRGPNFRVFRRFPRRRT